MIVFPLDARAFCVAELRCGLDWKVTLVHDPPEVEDFTDVKLVSLGNVSLEVLPDLLHEWQGLPHLVNLCADLLLKLLVDQNLCTLMQETFESERMVHVHMCV